MTNRLALRLVSTPGERDHIPGHVLEISKLHLIVLIDTASLHYYAFVTFYMRSTPILCSGPIIRPMEDGESPKSRACVYTLLRVQCFHASPGIQAVNKP